MSERERNSIMNQVSEERTNVENEGKTSRMSTEMLESSDFFLTNERTSLLETRKEKRDEETLEREPPSNHQKRDLRGLFELDCCALNEPNETVTSLPPASPSLSQSVCCFLPFFRFCTSSCVYVCLSVSLSLCLSVCCCIPAYQRVRSFSFHSLPCLEPQSSPDRVISSPLLSSSLL